MTIRNAMVGMMLVGLMLTMGQAPLPAVGPGTTTPATATEDIPLNEIADIRDGMVEALNRGDTDGVLKFLHPDIVVTWANGEVSHGPAGVKAYCDRMLKGANRIVESIHANPKVEGRQLYGPNVLISYGSLGDEFKLTDGKQFTLNSRFSSLLVKENGKWLLKGFHASANVFDNPVMGIAMKQAAIWAGGLAGVAGLAMGFLLGRIGRRRKAATA